MEIFMDDFTPYGKDFEESLKILEKVLTRCEQTQLSLSTENCHMMMSEGVVLGHFISANGIQVDPSKIKVIKIYLLCNSKRSVKFLGACWILPKIYRKFFQTCLSFVFIVNEGHAICLE